MNTKTISTVVAILGIIVFGGVFFKNNEAVKQKRAEQSQNTQQPSQEQMSLCGLTVISPLSNTIVSSPLIANAIVNNTNKTALGCSWTVFEAQAGVASLVDSTGTQVGFALLQTTSDWMTDGPVPYTGTITFSAQPAPGPLSLVITEDNPSGEGTPSVLTIPLIQ